MKVLKVITTEAGEEKTECLYPRHDMGEVIGLPPNHEYYIIKQAERPVYNPDIEFLRPLEILSEDRDNEFLHLKICYRDYEIVPHRKEVIIRKLNDSVGEHIENELPLWKQIKYIQKKLKLKEKQNNSDDEIEELNYYNSLEEWADRCRIERDKREEDYLNNNIIPSFIWEGKPEKLTLKIK